MVGSYSCSRPVCAQPAMRLGRSNSFRRTLSRRRSESEPASSEDGVLVSGPVAKLNSGKWQKSHAVVHGELLLLHKDAKDWTPFRAFPDEVVCLAAASVAVDSADGRDHCVVISAGGHRCVLCLRSDTEAAQWRDAVQRAASGPPSKREDAAPAATPTNGQRPQTDVPESVPPDSAAKLKLAAAREALQASEQRRAQLAERVAVLNAQAAADTAESARLEEQCRAAATGSRLDDDRAPPWATARAEHSWAACPHENEV
eukprot:1813916-Prymnesium_polylepis.1